MRRRQTQQPTRQYDDIRYNDIRTYDTMTNRTYDTMTKRHSRHVANMSATCRQRVGNVSATTSLANIIFDHVGDMSADMLPTCRQQSATCRVGVSAFLTHFPTTQTATFPAKKNEWNSNFNLRSHKSCCLTV